MRKLKLIAASISLVFLTTILAGCNKDIWQRDYEFTKAIIKLPNGEIVEGEVEEWTSYQQKSMVKVKIKGGKQYLGHSNNIILYND